MTRRRERSSSPRGGGPARGSPARNPRSPQPPPGRPAREPRDPSPRVPVPKGPPAPGNWLWTTRPGAERDLLDELSHALGPDRARRAGETLIESVGAPTFAEGSLDLTFARQGFRVLSRPQGPALADSLVASLAPVVSPAPAWALSVFVPDSDDGNRRAARAEALEAELIRRLCASDEALARRRVEPRPGMRKDGVYAQVALVGEQSAIAGEVGLPEAISLAPGGRARTHADADRPSRAARKIEEALVWLGVEPGPGELCVDLGAAPGGWSWALLHRRARVIAVDPALLRPDVARHRGLQHAQISAFEFSPPEPVDWLFCDMAWRPTEVAQMLAKWARRRWARMLVANLKLPMKQKSRFVSECREILYGGGWRGVRSRQLYHDREEITVTAHL